MKCQSLFSWKNTKNISVLSTENLTRVLSIKVLNKFVAKNILNLILLFYREKDSFYFNFP